MTNLAKPLTENLKCFLKLKPLYWIASELRRLQVDLEASKPNMKRRVSFQNKLLRVDICSRQSQICFPSSAFISRDDGSYLVYTENIGM